ncbi:phospholipase A1 PLIP2, chloroplastic-like [Neltuma alba]|uniref:phospholipase A1 PLIP2, chloroplastic-like n=1 Tax=Neltuma alba TaxID=207710 RepID=UPI0010A3E5C6|nr:phospholipase A1 PLIP2, chloroplastic-like [Prosopis alba]
MDTLCLRCGISGIVPSMLIGGSLDVNSHPSQVSAVGRSTTEKPSHRSVFPKFSFKYPLKSLWPGRSGNSRGNRPAFDNAVLVDNVEKKAIDEDNESGPEDQNKSWFFQSLCVKSMWTEKQTKGEVGNKEIEGKCPIDDQRNESGDDGGGGDNDDDDDDECAVCTADEDDEEDFQFDRDSFSRMLRRVSLTEARLYAQLSYLGNLAYSIPKIKPENLLRCCGLRFITSSLDKTKLATTGKNEASADPQEVETNEKDNGERNEENNKHRMNASVAYQTAPSTVHAQAKDMSASNFSKDGGGGDSLEEISDNTGGDNMLNTEGSSVKVTTDSVKEVVAGKEEVKQAVADDLNSTSSSPCEWYTCDDDQSGIRFFVVQGSESLASWQANILFEPIQFEGFDVLVHRGIYEAAKGIYQQMLPEVHDHLKSRGSFAKFRFTGHSLGGSLALLVNLMLLIRKEVPPSSLLPVITFGAPFIMCGGDYLLDKLELPRSHVQAITLHRDIVSRAFSCNYPCRLAELLKALNENFRNHSCLNNQKILYAPMGEFLILQPDDKFSPHHHLLPPGNGLYVLRGHFSDSSQSRKQLQAAQLAFLNSPHPLEILTERSAYGSGGTIIRDHDMKSYLKAVRTVMCREFESHHKVRRWHRRSAWWPPMAPPSRIDAGTISGRLTESVNAIQDASTFSGALRTGEGSWKRFYRIIASQHMHLFMVISFPARMLVLGAYNLIGFH